MDVAFITADHPNGIIWRITSPDANLFIECCRLYGDDEVAMQAARSFYEQNKVLVEEMLGALK